MRSSRLQRTDFRQSAFWLLLGVVAGLGIASIIGLPNSEQQGKFTELRGELAAQTQEVTQFRSSIDAKMVHVVDKVSDLQARMQRIDALGEHLTYAAGLEEGEFDFSAPVPSGGPVSMYQRTRRPTVSLPTLEKQLSELDALLTDRLDQLSLLASEIQYVEHHEQNRITGSPVLAGWLSSHYGYRTDPFTGKRAWHNGVDYAGRMGSEIVAVAGGVVTKSDRNGGYGYMVEISHADGYVTRYAHNKKNLVELGEVVEKGQVIAMMGSTGRSTGPHVHFEVLKNGKSYNPARYLRRAAR